MHLDQVLATALDALYRVEPVGNTHGLGGAQGQHHQAANAGFRGRIGQPVRFLVADRRQQAPVDAMGLGGFPKGFFISGQALLQMFGEGIGADIAQHVHVSVITLVQPLQGTVAAGLIEKFVGGVEQAFVFALGQDPGQAVLVLQIERGPRIGEVDLVHRQLVGLDQGQVDLAFVDHAQQVDGFHGVGLFIAQFGIFGLQRLQLLRLAAAPEHQNALADQVFDARRAALPQAIDDLGGGFQIGTGETRQLVAALAGHQAGGGQRRAAGAIQAAENILDAVGGLDLQLDTEMPREALDQFVLEAGLAVAILEIGRGAVAGDHAQYAFLLNALEFAGRFGTAAEHQEDSGRQQPGGAALAEQGLSKHRRSIRKGEPPPYLDKYDRLC